MDIKNVIDIIEDVTWEDGGRHYGNIAKARGIAVEALKKQMPQKVINRTHCPSCNKYLGCEGFEQKHCDECGQKLKWI